MERERSGAGTDADFYGTHSGGSPARSANLGYHEADQPS